MGYLNRKASCFFHLGLFIFLYICSSIQSELVTEENCIGPPLNWTEHWHEHRQRLARAYCNDDMVVYFDSKEIKQNDTESSTLSETWKQVKVLHNSTSFGNDTRLYVILHKNKYQGIHTAIYREKSHDYRNAIDFQEKYYTKFNFIQRVGDIVKDVIASSAGFPSGLVSMWKINDLIDLNIYLELGHEQHTKNLLNEASNKKTTISNKAINLLHDWYLPIYEQYGGPQVVSEFFKVIETYAQNEMLKSSLVLPGEFVHLWSQAARSDLRVLAYGAFGWDKEYELQFQSARQNLSVFKYMDSESLVESTPKWKEHWLEQIQYLPTLYTDDHLVLFVERKTHSNFQWLISSVSEAWKCARLDDNHTLFGSNPRLFAIITKDGDDGAHFAIQTDRGLDFGRIQYWWLSDSQKFRDKNRLLLKSQLREIMHIVSKVVWESSEWPNGLLSGWKFQEFIEYSIIVGTGGTGNALNYVRSISYRSGKVRFLQKWYLHVFENYGGMETIRKFLKVISSQANCLTRNSTALLSPGQFVYLWSVATNHDLRDLFEKEFAWSRDNQRQFQTASTECPVIVYSDPFKFETDADESRSSMAIGISISVGVVGLLVILALLWFQRRKLGNIREVITSLSIIRHRHPNLLLTYEPHTADDDGSS